MKKILLSSAAVLAFAGAATAGSEFKGDASLEYNSENASTFVLDGGLFWNGTASLNNGWEASAGIDIDLGVEAGSFGGITWDGSDWSIKLSNGSFGIKAGDVDVAADEHHVGVPNMGADAINEKGDTGGAAENFVLNAYGMVNGFHLSVSTLVADDGSTSGNGAGATIDAGGATISFAYQEEIAGSQDSVVTAAVAASLGGMDVKLAHASNDTTGETSTGVSVSYPMGATTLGASYSVESATEDNYTVSASHTMGALSLSAWWHGGFDEDWGVTASVDAGNGLTVNVGASEDDGEYVDVVQDLGSGAELYASWANALDDEIGPNDREDGLTLGLSLAFAM